MEELLMQIKGMEEDDEVEENTTKLPGDFDKYIATEEHTIKDIDFLLKKLSEEIEKLKKLEKND